MRRVAILTCLESAGSYCTGNACLSAFNSRSGAFRQYKDEDLELVAFFHCNGCEAGEQDEGMNEKIERILKIKPDAVHLGVCTLKDTGRCSRIEKITDVFLKYDIPVIHGTHASTRLENIGMEIHRKKET